MAVTASVSPPSPPPPVPPALPRLFDDSVNGDSAANRASDRLLRPGPDKGRVPPLRPPPLPPFPLPLPLPLLLPLRLPVQRKLRGGLST